MGKLEGDAKTSANQLNANHSTGPKNTSTTRFNAKKHGLLTAGITELDDAAVYRAILQDLKRETNPVGVIEQELVEGIARNMIRLRRAARLEAEYITGVLHPPIHDRAHNLMSQVVEENCGVVVDPGLPAPMRCGNVQPLVSLYQRYMTAIELQVYRGLHELERFQRMRKGERLPAPAAVDVNIHSEPRGAKSFVESSDKEALEGSLSKTPDKPRDPSPGDRNQEGEPAETTED